MSELEKKCIASWGKFCPDYEIKQWDEKNFDIKDCKYAEQAYASKKWAFVADYARFVILFKEGGIYFDTDVELVKMFDSSKITMPFFSSESCYRYSRDNFFYKNGEQNGIEDAVNPGIGMAFPAEHPILREVIEKYKKREFLIGNHLYDKTTVVNIVTDMLIKKGFNPSKKDIQYVDGITIYPPEFFSGIDNISKKDIRTINTIAIHHGAGSWLSGKEKNIVLMRKKFKGKGAVVYLIGCMLTMPVQFYYECIQYGAVLTLKKYFYFAKGHHKVGILN